MSIVRASNAVLAVNAFRGDAKTLLAFDLVADSARTGLAGFTVEVQPPQVASYYVDNNLRLAESPDHAQVPGQTPYSSVNAPIHKFRWVHVPGLVHQGGTPAFGTYGYVVTPRYFNAAGALQPLDAGLGVTVQVEVGPFVKGSLAASFTRGYVQSQAFIRHFGSTTHLRPADGSLIFDTSAAAGSDPDGQTYSYADEYEWLGFTARNRIFDLLAEVQSDPTLSVDVFAYDLNEPDVVPCCSNWPRATRSGSSSTTAQSTTARPNRRLRTSSTTCSPPRRAPMRSCEVISAGMPTTRCS